MNSDFIHKIFQGKQFRLQFEDFLSFLLIII